ncbi:MAG: peptidoglycan DD-metalloendopeptidase family protein [Clostridiaceae bacterium]|nr:peptidoglycan DD-metalloendopeptidase family protein [Clostridiaceae bacterium]
MMKGTGKVRILVIVMAFVMLLSFSQAVLAVGDINEAKDSLESIQDQLARIENELKQKQSIKTYYESLAKNMRNSINSQQLQLATYNEYINEVTNKINSLTETIEQAEKDYEEKVSILKERIINTYMSSNLSMLDVLMKSSSLKQYYDYLELNELIAKHDNQLIEEMKILMQDITSKRETMKMLKESYITLSEQAQIVLSNMQSMQNEALDTVNVTGETIKVLKAKENALEAEEAEMLNVILRLQREIDYIGGQMTWPLPSWKYMPTSNVFGWRFHPIFFEWRMHNGVDLGGTQGYNIVSANEGVVSIASWGEGYGYYVVVDHGGGISTLYAHCSKLLVSAGQSVKKGQVIALIGATGWATGPHLHFEVIIGGKRVDPLLYIDPSR